MEGSWANVAVLGLLQDVGGRRGQPRGRAVRGLHGPSIAIRTLCITPQRAVGPSQQMVGPRGSAQRPSEKEHSANRRRTHRSRASPAGFLGIAGRRERPWRSCGSPRRRTRGGGTSGDNVRAGGTRGEARCPLLASEDTQLDALGDALRCVWAIGTPCARGGESPLPGVGRGAGTEEGRAGQGGCPGRMGAHGKTCGARGWCIADGIEMALFLGAPWPPSPDSGAYRRA